MTKFIDTPEGEAFIATADTRETSSEIMRAIAFFARNTAEAVQVWENGAEMSGVCTDLDIWEHVTGNGLRASTDYCWGAAGTHWYDRCVACGCYIFHEALCLACDSAADELTLCRSDAGDGGWSLHRPGASDDDIASGDAPYLVTGTAEMGDDGRWTRPNAVDFAAALRAWGRVEG